MKIIHTEVLIKQGNFPNENEFTRLINHISNAITHIFWPPNSNTFTLYDNPDKSIRHENGVKLIKLECMKHLKMNGWSLETRVDIATLNTPGPLDATIKVGDKLFCFEWETGNISSSHRALNKMAIGLLTEKVIGGVLVLPTRKMYDYLTDRIGNYPEIEPYFPLWKSLPIKNGYLAVIAVEHDSTSTKVRPIPKGTDGRALR